jgi:ubiquinone/menaquinone biosynthesis C-methylase UbiE
MTDFEKTKKFYAKLKTKGMSSLISKERDSAYIKFLIARLPKKGKILDLACGYGRLTIPLAKAGYDVEGIDLAPNFIKDAKKFAKKEKVNVKFRTGNMLNLPCKDNSFDGIACIWSSFNHLLRQSEQVKALKEIVRILRYGGIAIIDMPIYEFKNGNHLIKRDIAGIENVDFIHDKKSISEALKKAGIEKYEVKKENIGGRKRLVAYVYK